MLQAYSDVDFEVNYTWVSYTLLQAFASALCAIGSDSGDDSMRL